MNKYPEIRLVAEIGVLLLVFGISFIVVDSLLKKNIEKKQNG